MIQRKRTFTIWLVKAAELEDVQKCCRTRLAGLHFDIIYTLPYAMCLNTASEIMANLDIEDGQTIVATTRFSSVGLISPEEMHELRLKVLEHAKETNTPATLDMWREVVPGYVEKALAKAHASIVATFASLYRKGTANVNLMVISNDRLPMLELQALSLKEGLKVPADGDVMQMRFDVKPEGRKVKAKLVFVQLDPLERNAFSIL